MRGFLPQNRGGTWIGRALGGARGPRRLTVVYSRVSSPDQGADLDRQVARVTAWATGQHLAVDRVVTDVGSAWNGGRDTFLALLRDPSVTTIVVEHRDRFARFGAEYVEASLAASGRRLMVVDPGERDDLVRDDLVRDDLVRDGLVQDGLVRDDLVRDDL